MLICELIFLFCLFRFIVEGLHGYLGNTGNLRYVA